MEPESLVQQHDKIIEHLDMLNAQVRRQNSMGRMLGAGIAYGIGFFIGTSIIATILFGIIGPMVGRISWVRSAFETGMSLVK
jgi:F0F1-type ATP synthase assembly protein I